MSKPRHLGIDLGTSGVKIAALDGEGRLLCQATAPLEVHRPKEGWSEQEPQSWINATRTALVKLAQKADLAQVRAIGLSGQMHGAVALDAEDRVLRPAILWNDTRSAVEARQLDENPLFHQISGNLVFPGFTAPKLLWMRNHEPALFEKVRKVLLPKDYLQLWLTGEYIGDMSDASGTSWFDPARRDWSDALFLKRGD